jgi:hypothetical protein
MKIELESLFNEALQPIDISFYFSQDKIYDFTCIYHSEDQDTGKKTSIYEHEGLLRTLLLKSSVIESKLVDELYSEGTQQLSFILDWNVYSKKIVIFDFNKVTFLDERKFADIIEFKSAEINSLYQKVFQLYNKGKGEGEGEGEGVPC